MEGSDKQPSSNTTKATIANMHVVLVKQYDGQQATLTSPKSISPVKKTKMIEKKISLLDFTELQTAMQKLELSTEDESKNKKMPATPDIASSKTTKQTKYLEYGLIGGAAALFGYFIFQNAGYNNSP
jgi:hypothetical protein